MLTMKQMLLASKDLLHGAILDEIEDRDAGASLPKGKCPEDVVELILKKDESAVVCQMARFVGRVDQAWGEDVGLVFYHMDLLTDKEIADALYYLTMGCLGHGVCLLDDYQEHIAKAEGILHKTFKATPIWIGSEWFSELVSPYLIYEDEDTE